MKWKQKDTMGTNGVHRCCKVACEQQCELWVSFSLTKSTKVEDREKTVFHLCICLKPKGKLGNRWKLASCQNSLSLFIAQKQRWPSATKLILKPFCLFSQLRVQTLGEVQMSERVLCHARNRRTCWYQSAVCFSHMRREGFLRWMEKARGFWGDINGREGERQRGEEKGGEDGVRHACRSDWQGAKEIRESVWKRPACPGAASLL